MPPGFLDPRALFDGRGLAVSLPAGALAGVALPGSLFSRADLADAAVSPDLALAIELVAALCAERAARLVFIARPEIFVGPVTLDWLNDQLDGISNHLCLSDGAAIRIVPGLRNHVFLHGLDRLANAEAFRRLARRAPELLAGLASQINSAFRIRVGGQAVRPPSLLLQAREPPPQPAEAEALLPFYLAGGAAEHAAAWMLAHGGVAAAALAGFARGGYLPLTETALAEPEFCETAADLLAATLFDPAACLVLGLPPLGPQASVADRLTLAVARLGRGRLTLPRTPAKNIFFHAGDPDPALFAVVAGPVECHLPASFAFWRQPPAFYAGFARVTLLSHAARRHGQAGHAALLARALGGHKPVPRWLAPAHEEPA